MEKKLADVSDVRAKINEARRFAVADGAVEERIRSLDGIEMLLVEVISELRDINAKLDRQTSGPP